MTDLLALVGYGGEKILVVVCIVMLVADVIWALSRERRRPVREIGKEAIERMGRKP